MSVGEQIGLASLFMEIERARLADMSRDLGPFPKNNPTASDLSECARETALALLHWQERPPITPELRARFEVGNETEPRVIAAMLRYGLKVVEQQVMFEIKDKSGRLVLRGKIDGKVEWERRRYPFDVKSVNPNAFQRLRTFAEVRDHPFFGKWVRQLWAYEYGHDIETGFLLLDNLLGEWRLIEVPLDFGEMEHILGRCEDAVEAVARIASGASEDEALPAYHYDPAVCRRCWCYGRVCSPPTKFHGLELISNPDFEAKLDRRGELAEASKEYEALDKEIKETVKGKDGLVIGAWLVQGKEITRQEKAREARTSTFWQAKISRLEAGKVDA